MTLKTAGGSPSPNPAVPSVTSTHVLFPPPPPPLQMDGIFQEQTAGEGGKGGRVESGRNGVKSIGRIGFEPAGIRGSGRLRNRMLVHTHERREGRKLDLPPREESRAQLPGRVVRRPTCKYGWCPWRRNAGAEPTMRTYFSALGPLPYHVNYACISMQAIAIVTSFISSFLFSYAVQRGLPG
jgi:hypothetical protein